MTLNVPASTHALNCGKNVIRKSFSDTYKSIQSLARQLQQNRLQNLTEKTTDK